MKKLFLIRHSYAEDPSFETDDFNRSLTEAGIKHGKKQAILFAEKYNSIDECIASDAKRAKETSEIFMRELKFSKNVLVEHFLYSDFSTQDFVNFLQKFDDATNTIAIVGHNPTLANLAYRLAPAFNHRVGAGTIIALEFDAISWKNIEIGSGKLIEIIA